MAIRHLGLIKTSLVDYPGTVASVVFTHGCNLRCPYCHNPECVLGSPPGDFLLLEEVLAFLEKRKSILGGVCITGGEPFLHSELPDLVNTFHALELKVKVDTNGTFPERLKKVHADFIDMDIKTSPENYGRLIPEMEKEYPGSSEKLGKAVQESLAWIKTSGLPHRFRITAAPGIVDEKDVEEITRLLGPGEEVLVSGFSPSVTLDPSWQRVQPFPDTILDAFAEILRRGNITVKVRYNHFH
ncbi:MAG: anaerobic ribonucleoside-triphosphate reductase activating protein [Spirochaetales bacterium]|nr:anaerobic ribonucleoside-triphosphate reductase activating protein [Spirochaetales bacterium]